MAFNTNAQTAPSNVTAPAAANWEKAAGFINLYLPSKDGAKRKLGAIPLRLSKANEKLLLDWLNEDASHVKTLAAKLIVEYNPSEQAAGSAFDLT
jgi:hypothetical protein